MSPTNTNIFHFLFLTWMFKCTYLLNCIGWRCSRVLYKDGQSCLLYLRRGCFCIFSLSIMLVVGLYILYDGGIVCIYFYFLRALCHEKNEESGIPLTLHSDNVLLFVLSFLDPIKDPWNSSPWKYLQHPVKL